jgi:hypothetical protein
MDWKMIAVGIIVIALAYYSVTTIGEPLYRFWFPATYSPFAIEVSPAPVVADFAELSSGIAGALLTFYLIRKGFDKAEALKIVLVSSFIFALIFLADLARSLYSMETSYGMAPSVPEFLASIASNLAMWPPLAFVVVRGAIPAIGSLIVFLVEKYYPRKERR